MKNTFAALAVILLVPGLARGQSGGGYDLRWNAFDCGGTALNSGGAYALAGTIGQSDAGVLAGGAYELRGGFWTGSAVVTDVPEPAPDGNGAPALTFQLLGGSPNPFREGTAVVFELQHEAQAAMRIYDLSGHLVRTLAVRPIAAGRHSISWDGTNDSGHRVACGIYILRLEAGEHRASQKLVFLR